MSEFITIICVLIVILQYLFFRKRKERYRKELYQVALPYFKSQMNPHFIKNLLQSINYLILFDSKEKASSCLKKFSLLVDQILKCSEMQLIPLEKEIALLENYIALQHIRFPNKFDFIPSPNRNATIVLEAGIDLENQMIPPMVIQTFVENAIVHGLEPLKEKGWLQIYISQTQRHLICRIIDNGIGCKASGQLHSRSSFAANGHNGIGTKNVKNRLAIIEKSLGLKIGFQIEDLDKKQQKGTLVTLLFPNKLDDMQEFRPVDFENMILNR
ncbi:MAG: sensor histidine kinase [Marinifilaceae bacterium]